MRSDEDDTRVAEKVVTPRRRKFLVFLVVLALALWILVVLATLIRSEEFDPYWVLTIPGIDHALSAGFLALPTDTPGWQILMVSLSRLTGSPLGGLLFLPFGGIAAFPTSYVMFRRLVGGGYPCLLISAFVTIEIARGPSTYSTFAHAWTYPLLFVFMNVYVGILQASAGRSRWILASMALFVGLHVIYYTGELVAILFVLILTVYSGLGRATRIIARGQVRIALNLAIGLAVIFLVFNQVVYQVFLPRLAHTSVEDSFSWVFGRLGSLLVAPANPPEPFRLFSSQNSLITWIAVLQFLLIMSPIGYLIASTARAAVGSRTRSGPAASLELIVVWTITTLTAAYLAIYFVLGQVNISLVVLLLPIASLWVVGRASRPGIRRFRWIPVALCLVLVVTSGVKFASAVAQKEIGRPSTFADVSPSVMWYINARAGTDKTLLVDLHTAARFALVGGEMNAPLQFVSYNSTLYGAVVGAQAIPLTEMGVDFLAVDLRSLQSPTYGGNWQVFQPLRAYYESVQNNTYLSGIYDDGALAIFSVGK